MQVIRTRIVGCSVEMLSEENNNSTVMQTMACNKWNGNEQHDLTLFEIIWLANIVYRIDVCSIVMQGRRPKSFFFA